MGVVRDLSDCCLEAAQARLNLEAGGEGAGGSAGH